MPSSSPLARLWLCARTAITALCASLLPLDTLTEAERRRLRGWLRALEAFCRRVALTEALQQRCAAPSPARQPTKPTAAAKRRPAFRLWPRFKAAGARIRRLGGPLSIAEIVAERRRTALAARLAAARSRHKPAHLRLADRIEALQRFLDAPARAIAGFARKLRHAPALARVIVAARAPACPFLSEDDVDACITISQTAATNTS
ncbi:hypothetical protein [Terricaulis sp.]|uniref:hypothetical protein n=1 Tax=Terricaulis sp. TaxID=2768686 RepID=UPI0037835CAA